MACARDRPSSDLGSEIDCYDTPTVRNFVVFFGAVKQVPAYGFVASQESGLTAETRTI